MTYINPRQKPLAHLDRLVGWQRGEKPAPVTIEWDLSNRCTYGCSACLTDGAQVIVRGVGPVSIAGVMLGHEVLAFDESTGAVRWTQVRATSVRYAHEHIVRVESAGRVIEATREHPFYTKHGWTNAESINTGSEVLHLWLRPAADEVGEGVRAHVLDRQEVDAPAVRVRMRLACEEPRGLGGAGARDATDEGLDRGVQARRSQPDEASGGRSASVCLIEGATESGMLGSSPWQAGTAADAGGKGTRVSAYADVQSDEAGGSGRESGCGVSIGSRQRDAHDAHADGGGQGADAATDAGRQPDARSGRERAQSLEDEGRTIPVWTGAVVLGGVRGGWPADSLHRLRRLLAVRQESGLQSQRAETTDRADGRLLPSSAATHVGELCGADDPALPKVRARVLGGDGAAWEAGERAAHCGRDCWGETVSGDRAELRVDLAWAVVDRVSTERRIVAVYNLETEAGTYLADGIVVHNCHFAHTHTRGPLTRTARVLPMAHDRGGDLADTDLVLRALMEARLAGVKSIVWTGGGEPTTHPDWHFLMSTAHGMGFEQGLYTMGSLISTTQAATIRQWLSWVVVSLDHPDAATYAREKRTLPSMFDRACETVRALGHGKAAIGVSFLLHAGNYTQAQDMLALSRSLGATYTTFRPLVETAPSEPGVLLGDRAWVRVATPGLQALAAQPDVELDVARFHEWAGWSGHGYTVCQGPALNTTITPDGRLWVCPNRREYAGSCLGDLRVESFADIWARHPGRFPVTADCRAQCRLHHVNQALDALAQPREHANFI